ncbi:ankyrin repeat-containing domain protein [Hypoxylon sp. FL1857]|nr:ankyrin repeat-containing domain protein [Hypoxylon sp. FL1857]
MTPSTKLRDAIYSGEVEEVRTCLNSGISANEPLDGEPPLTFAIRNGEEDIAILLIESGADLSLEPEDGQLELHKTSSSPPKLSWRKRICKSMISRLAGWSRRVAYDELWIFLLRSDMWPVAWKPVRTAILSKTVFGSIMRSTSIESVGVAWKTDLYSPLQGIARLIPSLLAMFIHSRRDVSGWTREIETMSSWDIWGALRSFYRDLSWTFEGALFIISIEVAIFAARVGYSRIMGRGNSHTTKIYGGTSALQAVLAFPSNSERVAKALLEHGLFSPGYVKESLQTHHPYSPRFRSARIFRLAWSTDGSLVRKLWGWSLFRGAVPITSALLDLGVSTNEPAPTVHPLWFAALLGHDGAVNAILRKGKERNELSAEDIQQALVVSASKLPESPQIETNLGSAERTFYILLDEVERVNDNAHESGIPALGYAVARGNVPAVVALLGKGANVNREDEKGRTPLLYLCPDNIIISDDTAFLILRALLKAGADIDHQDNEGYTILLWQFEMQHISTARMLLNNGANPNQVLKNGETTLEVAARCTGVGMIRALINAGAHLEDGLEPESAPRILFRRAASKWFDGSASIDIHGKGIEVDILWHERRPDFHLICNVTV